MRIKDVASKDPSVHSGDLVFTGTRVPVNRLTSYLKGGYTLDHFLEHFPTVQRRQAEAFLEHGLDEVEEKLDKELKRAARVT